MPTEQTTKRITKYDKYSSITTNAYLQTTDTLQSTTKKTKEDTIANDQISGNIIGIHVVNRDDSIRYYAKGGDKFLHSLSMYNN